MPKKAQHKHPWGLALLTAVWLAACTPALNWREARFDNAPLVALLPCKPDKGVRPLQLQGRQVELTMQGCEASGALFTVGVAQLASPADAGALLGPWKAALLANARSSTSVDQPFVLPGTTPWPGAVRASFSGQSADGSPVVGQVALFVRGAQLYQAAVFSDKPQLDAANTFFAGLKLP